MLRPPNRSRARSGRASLPLVLAAGLGLAIGLAFLALQRDRRRDASEPTQPRISPAVEDAYARAAAARRSAAAAAIDALHAAVRAADRTRAAELAESLVRLGEPIVEPALAALTDKREWSFRLTLLDVLARFPSEDTARGLAGFCSSLHETETALKIEVVRRLARIPGGPGKDALTHLLSKETALPVRDAIAAALLALGMTPDEAARLAPPERRMLEPRAQAQEDLRARVQAVERSDPKSDASLALLRTTALEEDVPAVAMSAFSKLEKRDDARAAEILLERARRPAFRGEDRIVQTNAIAALARMRSIEARLAMKQMALGDDANLRLQAVELLGGFGDAGMLPLIDQAAALDSDRRMAEAAVRARTAIQARAAAASERRP